MSADEFRNEKLYQCTMNIARKMLADGLLSQDEYRQMNALFLDKYKPIFGEMFSDTALTFKQ